MIHVVCVFDLFVFFFFFFSSRRRHTRLQGDWSSDVCSPDPRGFDDRGEAIAEANRLSYGLAAYAFTRSIKTADRKSTRLNSSHLVISYAVFCLKKKKKKIHNQIAIYYITSHTPHNTYDNN